MEEKQVPHVLIFPAPAQGHVNSMLILAELLCVSDIPVTFLNTEHYHRRLIRYADAEARFSSYPDFRFETIPDGLPDDHPRSFAQMVEVFQGIESVMKPSFRTLMFSNRFKSLNRPPVTCVIIDGLIASSTINVCMELGIPAIAFRTASACCLWSFFSFKNLVDAGEIPFQDEAMDKLITSVPGMVGFLRSRDLPSSYRVKNVSDPFLKFSVSTTMDSVQASATILNTFDDLEGPVLSEIAKHFPKIYTIGPLHALLSSRRSSSSSLNFSNSLCEEDRSCITWLDSQPSKSVVYVSFGSLALITRKQMLEFWYGLVNSGKRFLWVIRPDSVSDEKNSEIPAELTEGTEKRGYMVGWSPQEDVLVHTSVGGFLTHSGWNSTLESIVAGVPMICFPHMGDQQINSRFVSEVWKIGLDMKDTCDRLIVERMVNDLMENKREELMRSVNRLSSDAKKSVTKGGSSYCNLELLVDDIKLMNLAV